MVSVAELEGNGVEQDVLFVDFHRILVPEWRLADEELVDQNAKSPPIYWGAVACGG